MSDESDSGRSERESDHCPVCDTPLEGETVLTAEGEVHEDCAHHDDGADVLPDGGVDANGTNRSMRGR